MRRYLKQPSLVSSDGNPPAGCKRWFDGCNTCDVTSVGNVTGCTSNRCIEQGAAFCQKFQDGTACQNVACNNREQRNTVAQHAMKVEAQYEAAEATVRDLNLVAADGVLWLLCGWALVMLFPAVRCVRLLLSLRVHLSTCLAA